MGLWDKKPQEILPADLQALVDAGVSELRTIEFKESLAVATDSERKEFLADVSSFANAAGGHLIYGMRESAGVATEVCGIELANPDAEILRLENLIRDGLDPRLPSHDIASVALSDGKSALVLRIAKSWAGPHMVRFQNHGKFYSRNSRGKYQLDVDELRATFASSGDDATKLSRFRPNRIAKIVSGETPVPLQDCPKIVLHLVPQSALSSREAFNVVSLAPRLADLAPIYATGWDTRLNFDGLLTWSQFREDQPSHSYLQIFRNGSIEAVEAFLLRPRDGGVLTIPSLTFDNEILESVARFLLIQRSMGVLPPIYIMLSMLGIKGYTMGVPTGIYHDSHPIDREMLLVPEVMVEKYETAVDAVLKPALDIVWNASGWAGSIYYDSLGKWIGRRS